MLLLLLLSPCHCPHGLVLHSGWSKSSAAKAACSFGFIVSFLKECGLGSPRAEPRSFKRYAQLPKKVFLKHQEPLSLSQCESSAFPGLPVLTVRGADFIFPFHLKP